MNPDSQFERIEGQLRDEADRLLRSQTGRPPTATLLAKHRRRGRARTLARTSGVAGLLMIVGLAGWAAGLWEGNRASDRGPTANIERRPVSDVDRTDGPSVPGTSADVASSDRSLTERPVIAIGEPIKTPGGPVVVPIIIAREDGDRQEVITTGFYVPQHVERVDLLDLSPAEQRAIRRVLDMEEVTTRQARI